MRQTLHPKHWGLSINGEGHLTVGGMSTVQLAAEYGTPLHVVNEDRLEHTARRFLTAMASAYPGHVSVHYPFKCNSIPAVVRALRLSNLKAEVMTEFELALALRSGFRGSEIIVNGPCKTQRFLQECVEANVRFIVVDSIPELRLLGAIAKSSKTSTDLLLRVNPDYVPSGMNEGSATGSRKGCAFGLDLKGGEVSEALRILLDLPALRFRGYHLHIGTGISDPQDYAKALRCLPELLRCANGYGLDVSVVDAGGGFASTTTREFTSGEMLLYGGCGHLPAFGHEERQPRFEEFAAAISNEITCCFPSGKLPELVVEPGRCITSQNQFLLLTVHYSKERPGAGTWLITDGGLGTVTLPTYYEYHEVFVCNDVTRPISRKVNIIGPACFAGDVVYRNKWMPEVHPGEVLAIMDTGAYFNALESSFGFARPAVISIRGGHIRVARRRESLEDWLARDQEEVIEQEVV